MDTATLFKAVQQRNLEYVKKRVREKGFDVNQTHDDQTLLSVACRSGHL